MAQYGYSSPMRGGDYYYSDMNSPSPTPSPHHYPGYTSAKTPTRPATRAHFRGASAGVDFRPATAMGSPRFNSSGEYATAPTNAKVSSSRRQSFSKERPPSSQRHPSTPKRERRHSHSYHHNRPERGESDEDEFIEVDGVTYVLPAQSRSRDPRRAYFYSVAPGYGTDHFKPQVRHAEPMRGPYVYEQRTPEMRSPRYDELPQRSATRVGHHSSRPSTHTRRPSEAAVPKRPSTTKPTVQASKKAAGPAKATLADAERHHIPPGYSLKNWDPAEEPIMLLGSVFDCNSLGKWIYDWSVATYKPGHPLCNKAGELWLLLIELSGKMKRIEETMPKVRATSNRELLDDFIDSGERLLDKLRSILKRCEEPMLKGTKDKKSNQLPQNSGVEFINSLLGKDRYLDKTERFMGFIQTWIQRFDQNCDPILKSPTM